MSQNVALVTALQDFQTARNKAALQEATARLTGKSTSLLSYEDVRKKLKAEGSMEKGLQEIPIDAIVGSVDRFNDFTRTFMPRQDNDSWRWANVQVATQESTGVPPITVYQIGGAYFVVDGNHRVSVSRQMGNTSIQAYVTEIRTKVPLSPNDQPNDIILKAEYAQFLERTNLDKSRPDSNLWVTSAKRPGMEMDVGAPSIYWTLEAQIEAHRFYIQQTQGREISYEEAAAMWYDEVYWPVMQVIYDRGMLIDFPERTVTDLYLWLSEHRAVLRQNLEWEIPPDLVADNLTTQFNSKWSIGQLGSRVLEAVTPNELEAGPSPGQWRKERLLPRLLPRQENRLFSDVMVAVTGHEKGWLAFEQAIIVARREDGRLKGLHVVDTEEEKNSPAVKKLRAEFNQRCQAANVSGELAVEVGKTVNKICERAWLTDAVVVPLSYPPDSSLSARLLGSGFRNLIRRCARPILTVPGKPSLLKRLLLAYDDSPKAKEALFVATYLAQSWPMEVVVLTVIERENDHHVLITAQEYLKLHNITATFVESQLAVGEAILQTAQAQACDVIAMGGYGRNPMLEVVLGSAVDQVLRESPYPTLICR